MHITRWGEYGILCSLYLATRSEAGTAIGAAEIAKAQNIPLQYAQQILHRLRKGGVIKSVRGPHGGFQLSKPPAETNLKEILYAAEGATFEVVCDVDPVYSEKCGPLAECGLKHVWYELKDAIDGILDKTSLASIAAKHQLHVQSEIVPAPLRSATAAPQA